LVLFALIAIGGATLYWSRDFVGLADSRPVEKARNSSATTGQSGSGNSTEVAAVDLSDKQAGAVKIGPVGSRDFVIFKTAVGTIDFNENMLVQVFSQYQGKILKAFYNIGDDVKAGDVLFTIDSPDLLQAESTLLAAAGVLELQKRTLARVTGLLKAGGSAAEGRRPVDLGPADRGGRLQGGEGCGPDIRQDRRGDRPGRRQAQGRFHPAGPEPDLGQSRHAQCRSGISDSARRCTAAIFGRGFVDDVDAGECHRDRRAGLQGRSGSRG
jgi:biotin carboxyl carrier protein